MSRYTKFWTPYRNIHEKEIVSSSEKSYSTPPNLYVQKQPPNLTQFLPLEALEKGTLWKQFYDPFISPYEQVKE